MAIKGIDVSKHNGIIDWSKVKNDGIKFAIIRGGYGNSYVDPQFKINIEGAIKNGIEVGVYWFSYATNTTKAKEEAKKCLEVIKPYKDKITYPVFFDFEYDSVNYAKKQGVAITKTLASNMAKTFLQEIKNAGYISGMYTNLDFSSRYFSSDILNTYDTWIAQYSSKCSYTGKYTMWQYSEKGKVAGINGNVDMNYCYKEYKKASSNTLTTIKSDNNVKLLQQALNKSYGLKLAVDGSLGPKTKAAIEKHYLKKVIVNEHVKVIQTFLNKAGYKVTIDGSYGPATETVIKKFQKNKKLSVDGYCGLNTHIALINALK